MAPSVPVVPEDDTTNKHSPYHGSVRWSSSKRRTSHGHNHDRERDHRRRAFSKPLATTPTMTSRNSLRKCRPWWALLLAVAGSVAIHYTIISSRQARAFLGTAESLVDDGAGRKRNSNHETSSRVPPPPLSPTHGRGRERVGGTLQGRKSDKNLADDSLMHMDVVDLVTTGGGRLDSRGEKQVRQFRQAKPPRFP